MKMRRLPELDLARFIALAGGPFLEPALEAFDAGGGFWSYDPVRASTSDILGAKTPLHGALEPVKWELIERQIVAACKRGDDQSKANLGVAKSLFAEARNRQWEAVSFQMGKLPIGSGETVRYWSDVVLADDEGMFIVYWDHRRRNGATNAEHRRVIFSMQHLWVRERHPDLASARLAVGRFADDAERTLSLHFDHGAKLIGAEELDQRARTVYESWDRMLRRKAAPKKRAAIAGMRDIFED